MHRPADTRGRAPAATFVLKMTPQSTACFTEKLKVTGAFQKIARKTYIRTMNCPTFAATLDKVRSDASWKTCVVDCAHDVMIDEPDELAHLLVNSI
jgi:hypothetical protein